LTHKYKLFIFDLDGTLVNTEGLYVKSLQRACEERDFLLNDRDATKIIYGKAWSSVFADLEKIKPQLFKSCQDIQESAAIYFDSMIKSEELEIKPSVNLLKDLAKDNDVCIVSGSSRSHIAHFIKELGITKQVKFFVGSEDYQQGKPKPECFLQAAQLAGVTPDECLVFEDSTAGVSAAKAAHMDCTALKSPENPQDLSSADTILNCLSQFNFDALNKTMYNKVQLT
jgi:HAD superfamily hydrolase (TIGR01509 family)